jgi:hypothetical protein
LDDVWKSPIYRFITSRVRSNIISASFYTNPHTNFDRNLQQTILLAWFISIIATHILFGISARFCHLLQVIVKTLDSFWIKRLKNIIFDLKLNNFGF